MTAGPLLILSCSLNPESRSRRMAREAEAALRKLGHEAELVDLRDVDLPMCDGGDDITIPARELRDKIRQAHAIILSAPIYNYDVNAAAKNLIEVTGSAWRGKVVGLMAAAGGRSSYMSLMGLANSLMLDFRCWIAPRFVYATEIAEAEDRLPLDIADRIEQLARTTWEAGAALHGL